MVKLALVGGREFTNYALFAYWVDNLIDVLCLDTSELEIVSGEARGTDALAKRYANEKGYSYKGFPADWSIGKQAGYIRNADIVKYSDYMGAVLMLSDRYPCKGTKSSISMAKRKGIPVHIMVVEEPNPVGFGNVK